MHSAEHDATATMTVVVHDEPVLVVLGVERMLAGVARVHHTRDAAAERVDVVLCDPAGRPVPPATYLSSVVASTRAPVVVFSWQAGAEAVRRARAAGAAAYLSKTAGVDDLTRTLLAVRRGESSGFGPEPEEAPVLSNREREVLTLICRGHSNLEIARDLYVSVNSVKTYVRQVYQKIGVARRAQAVAWGLEHGF